jgi:hypothetical protein
LGEAAFYAIYTEEEEEGGGPCFCSVFTALLTPLEEAVFIVEPVDFVFFVVSSAYFFYLY